jgi:hypothetical protein
MVILVAEIMEDSISLEILLRLQANKKVMDQVFSILINLHKMEVGIQLGLRVKEMALILEEIISKDHIAVLIMLV